MMLLIFSICGMSFLLELFIKFLGEFKVGSFVICFLMLGELDGFFGESGRLLMVENIEGSELFVVVFLLDDVLEMFKEYFFLFYSVNILLEIVWVNIG